jgi:dolichyl-phosphate-mannose--protein O-mannosyl transferase
MKINRGTLQYVGKRGLWNDTITGVKLGFLGLLVLILIFLIFAGFAFLGYAEISGIPDSHFLAGILSLFPVALFILILFLKIGFEIDAIYEYGVTNRYTSLIRYLKGKSFQSFRRVLKIGYGKIKIHNEELDFLAIFDQDTDSQIISTFVNYKYENNFFNILIETLSKKCSSAKWVETDYEDLQK